MRTDQYRDGAQYVGVEEHVLHVQDQHGMINKCGELLCVIRCYKH